MADQDRGAREAEMARVIAHEELVHDVTTIVEKQYPWLATEDIVRATLAALNVVLGEGGSVSSP